MSGPAPLPPPNPQIDPATGAVVFNYQAWAARFPTLAQSISQDIAQVYFDDAGSLYFNNTGASPASDAGQRQRILFLIVAHLATLYGTINGEEPSSMVGRISSASEGSVSVSSEMPGVDDITTAWWMQTPFGASAYQAMRKFALTWYVPGPRRYSYGPRPPYWQVAGGPWGPW
jgi:hypothetical protein